MTKTATKSAETIENAAFDPGKAADQFRAFAENGLEQSRLAYDKFKSQAEHAQQSMETTLETARQAGSEMSLKSISAMRTNAELGFAHFEALVKARTLSEMLELQTAFVRQSIELAVEQAKDFQATSSKATEDVIKPMKDAFEKSIKQLEAA
jgi:phasin